MCGNASAAVAVQGTAAPVMECNVVLHNGNGGIWLGEKAGGIFTGNRVEESPKGWRIGSHVTARVESPVALGVSLSSFPQYEQELRDRIEDAMQYCRPLPRLVNAVFVQNPGVEDKWTIGMVFIKFPSNLLHTCETLSNTSCTANF